MTELFRRLPPLGTLVAFEAAARHGSFTRAAEEIALSQASVSRRVRELERDLDTRLFERRRYDVVLTEDGEALAATVRVALSDLARLADRLRDQPSESGLTIFTDLSLANALVAPVVGEFQRLHPDLDLRVVSSYQAIESSRDPFDVGLQHGRWAEDQFDLEPIADDVIFPVCSAEVAERLPVPLGPVELASQPLLHLVVAGRKWPDWRSFLAFFRIKEPPPIEGLTFSSYHTCLDVAERGGGVALGWARSVQARLDTGRLVRLPGLTMPLVDAVYLYRPKAAKPRPIAEDFVELLRNHIGPVG